MTGEALRFELGVMIDNPTGIRLRPID